MEQGVFLGPKSQLQPQLTNSLTRSFSLSSNSLITAITSHTSDRAPLARLAETIRGVARIVQRDFYSRKQSKTFAATPIL